MLKTIWSLPLSRPSNIILLSFYYLLLFFYFTFSALASNRKKNKYKEIFENYLKEINDTIAIKKKPKKKIIENWL